MSIVEAIILGLIQGLTEFIPVSSSGHLVLAQDLLGVSSVGLAFDTALHLGTLLALIVFFRREIWKLVLGILGKNNYKRLAWLLLIATVPTAATGIFIRGAAETTLRAPWVTAVMLILVALAMFYAEHLARGRPSQTAMQKISLRQALGVGLAQVLALIPGTSRAGATITAGLLFGMDRVTATRFSFLLAIPIIAGVALADILSGVSLAAAESGAVLGAGIAASFVSGMFAIGFLLKFLSKHSLAVFAWYRIALGVLILSGLIIF